MKNINQLNLVPTVIPNLSKLMNEFIKLKLSNIQLNEKEFKERMFSNNKNTLTDKTKEAYCKPFGKKELNLFDESLESINKLQINSYNWLNDKYKSGFIFKDDRCDIYLKTAWIVGFLNKYYFANDFNPILVNAKIAGNTKASKNLLQVGLPTGNYFNLLDNQGKPSKNYQSFYCNDMSLIEDRILNVIKKVKVYL
jgi:hypothetical protein